jgi:hypothetical protein
VKDLGFEVLDRLGKVWRVEKAREKTARRQPVESLRSHAGRQPPVGPIG